MVDKVGKHEVVVLVLHILDMIQTLRMATRY